jgi:hypothetical protein
MKCDCGGHATRDLGWLPEPGMDATIRQYRCDVCHKVFQYAGGRRMKISGSTTSNTGGVDRQKTFLEIIDE